MVPKEIYRIRRLHFVFWETSRLARGLPKTFTYSTWDDKAVSFVIYKFSFVVWFYLAHDVSR